MIIKPKPEERITYPQTPNDLVGTESESAGGLDLFLGLGALSLGVGRESAPAVDEDVPPRRPPPRVEGGVPGGGVPGEAVPEVVEAVPVDGVIGVVEVVPVVGGGEPGEAVPEVGEVIGVVEVVPVIVPVVIEGVVEGGVEEGEGIVLVGGVVRVVLGFEMFLVLRESKGKVGVGLKEEWLEVGGGEGGIEDEKGLEVLLMGVGGGEGGNEIWDGGEGGICVWEEGEEGEGMMIWGGEGGEKVDMKMGVLGWEWGEGEIGSEVWGVGFVVEIMMGVGRELVKTGISARVGKMVWVWRGELKVEIGWVMIEESKDGTEVVRV